MKKFFKFLAMAAACVFGNSNAARTANDSRSFPLRAHEVPVWQTTGFCKGRRKPTRGAFGPRSRPLVSDYAARVNYPRRAIQNLSRYA